MGILVLIVGLALLGVGGFGLYASLDLLPTELGVLYATGGAVAVCSGLVMMGLALVVVRVGALARVVRTLASPPSPDATLPATAVEPAAVEEPVAGEAEEAPINENRAGHLPTLGEVEQAIETPEPAPTLVGRYSAGGANYMIFSDGSIEAETATGAQRFASMADFKRYVAETSE